MSNGIYSVCKNEWIKEPKPITHIPNYNIEKQLSKWKQLIDHGMKKGDLCAKTGLSSSTIAKMTNCESVKLSVLEKICKELDCNFGDLIDYVPDNKEK